MTLIKRGTQIRDLPEGFAKLLRKLRSFTVNGWEYDSDGPTWPKLDREQALVTAADVVSSEIATEFGGGQYDYNRRHVLAIDLDVPAYLVESSTEGHHHLYVDVPGGIPHHAYMKLLDALAEAKVIQSGYANVSKQRGHSDLRLPWVRKQSPFAVPEGPKTEAQAKSDDRVEELIARLEVPPL